MKKTNAKDYLKKNVVVKTDRQLGTNHPKHGFMYMLNYGYIPNTISGDGEELDAYIVGVFEPVEEFEGRVITSARGSALMFLFTICSFCVYSLVSGVWHLMFSTKPCYISYCCWLYLNTTSAFTTYFHYHISLHIF